MKLCSSSSASSGRARRGHLDRADLRHHHRDPRTLRGATEVRADALFQVFCLADVERRAVGGKHAVDARQIRQSGDELLRIERFAHADIVPQLLYNARLFPSSIKSLWQK
jgi:hypothetical protein